MPYGRFVRDFIKFRSAVIQKGKLAGKGALAAVAIYFGYSQLTKGSSTTENGLGRNQTQPARGLLSSTCNPPSESSVKGCGKTV